MTRLHPIQGHHLFQLVPVSLLWKGFVGLFFKPTRQGHWADTKNPLNAAHTGPFMVCSDNLLFLFFAVAMLWLQYKPFTTIFTPTLLAAASIMPIPYNILAATFTTCMDYLFANHFLSLLPNHFICSTTKI